MKGLINTDNVFLCIWTPGDRAVLAYRVNQGQIGLFLDNSATRTQHLVALFSRNGPVCPWSTLYASTAPSPGVHARCKCPYLTQGSAQHSFQFQRYSSTINAHKYSFFIRTVPAWNALSPVSVCADSVVVFHSSICNNFVC